MGQRESREPYFVVWFYYLRLIASARPNSKEKITTSANTGAAAQDCGILTEVLISHQLSPGAHWWV
jgi:hypothetical protein